MKIMNRESFMALPEWTVFSYYEPCVFTGLHIKGSNWNTDFAQANLIAPVACDSSEEFLDLCREAENGKDVALDFEDYGRDGMFDDAQLFAVYSVGGHQGADECTGLRV